MSPEQVDFYDSGSVLEVLLIISLHAAESRPGSAYCSNASGHGSRRSASFGCPEAAISRLRIVLDAGMREIRRQIRNTTWSEAVERRPEDNFRVPKTTLHASLANSKSPRVH